MATGDMKLADNGSSVTFSPLFGYFNPEDRGRSVHITPDGTLYIYEWGSKEKHEIPLNNIVKADADQIVAWWQAMTTLTFTPDLDAPGTTKSVKIINETKPLQMWGESGATGWKNLYRGSLVLHEI